MRTVKLAMMMGSESAGGTPIANRMLGLMGMWVRMMEGRRTLNVKIVLGRIRNLDKGWSQGKAKARRMGIGQGRCTTWGPVETIPILIWPQAYISQIHS
jgi:hypothetical protein